MLPPGFRHGGGELHGGQELVHVGARLGFVF
jgi:hypothetical protein